MFAFIKSRCKYHQDANKIIMHTHPPTQTGRARLHSGRRSVSGSLNRDSTASRAGVRSKFDWFCCTGGLLWNFLTMTWFHWEADKILFKNCRHGPAGTARWLLLTEQIRLSVCLLLYPTIKSWSKRAEGDAQDVHFTSKSYTYVIKPLVEKVIHTISKKGINWSHYLWSYIYTLSEDVTIRS